MYNGKRSKKTPHMSKRAALLVLSLVMILSVSVGGTLAYIILQTQEVKNTFTPGTVDTSITEDFPDSKEKKNVAIDNSASNVDVYVRAKVVVTWVVDDGKGGFNTLPETPVSNQENLGQYDYTISYNEGDWQLHDGFWYCNEVVEAGQSSPDLISSCMPVEGAGPVEGARLQVTILSQSVQATEDALKDAGWAWAIPEVNPLAN